MSTSNTTQPFAEKTLDCASLDLPLPHHDTNEQTAACSAMPFGLFSGEPVARSFGHEGAAKRPPRIDVDGKFFHPGSNSCSSPALLAPACHVPSPHVLALDKSIQVCTQLRSSSLSSCSGIAPDLFVQASTPNAVGGPHASFRSSPSVQTFRPAAPNSVSAACAISAPHAYATPSATSSPSLLPTSASSLAVATARPPGAPSACAVHSPDIPSVHANAVLSVSGPFANSGPSKRRLLFVPGPKLAKRLKLG